MARSVECIWAGGLYRFRLWQNPYDPFDVSGVTAVRLTRGAVVVNDSAPASGDVRWAQTEYQDNEIAAKLSTAFVAESGDVTVRITSPTYPAGLDFGTFDIGTGGEFVAAAGVWVEQCDVCGRWFKIETLVRQLQIRHRYAGANYCTRSRYNPTDWTVTADYLGDVSMGRPRWRHIVDPTDGAPSRMADGASSFWGDSTLQHDAAIDMSTWTTAVIEGQFGVNQVTTLGALTVQVGLMYDPGGVSETFYEAAEIFLTGGGMAWGKITLSAIPVGRRSALHPHFIVTTETDQQVWWGERFRVQEDISDPKETFYSWVETKGTAVVHTVDAKTLGKTVVCPEDWERLKKQVDEFEPTFDSITWIEDENQEL